MKKYLFLILVVSIISRFCFSQSVEKEIYGIQMGLFGLWGQYEMKIQNKIALRGEVGFDNGMWLTVDNSIGYFFVPSFVLEPRWYYNLNKRKEKSKKIDRNCGNYL